MSQTAGRETATQTLHRLTSGGHSRRRAAARDAGILADFRASDPARLPWPVKRYPQHLPRLRLPRELPGTAAPAIAVLAGTAQAAPADCDLRQLSRLLHLSAGIVRITGQPPGGRPLRAAGSAGARFPLEVYVAVPDGGPLPPGVHWYGPWDHVLVQVGPPPRGGAPALVVTGIPWRTGWRYRERGWRHLYWDAGTMLSQVLALAASAGLEAALYTRFPDVTVADLTGADRVHELPVAVVSLGDGAPALEPAGPAAAGQVDAAPMEFPLVTAAQRAGERDQLGRPWEAGQPADVRVSTPATVEAVVMARGSQRRMDASRGLPEELLRVSMSVAVRGISVPHRVVVHDVTGLAAGLYRWPDLSGPARPGALRDEVYRVCLGQALARDAAFVTIAATDISGLDDRQYREAQLAAGLSEGRLHLAAYALGASATGMTFTDSQVPPLLGEQLDPLLFTCVGVPAYASAPGGPPGAPVRVRIPPI